MPSLYHPPDSENATLALRLTHQSTSSTQVEAKAKTGISTGTKGPDLKQRAALEVQSGLALNVYMPVHWAHWFISVISAL